MSFGHSFSKSPDHVRALLLLIVACRSDDETAQKNTTPQKQRNMLLSMAGSGLGNCQTPSRVHKMKNSAGRRQPYSEEELIGHLFKWSAGSSGSMWTWNTVSTVCVRFTRAQMVAGLKAHSDQEMQHSFFFKQQDRGVGQHFQSAQ